MNSDSARQIPAGSEAQVKAVLREARVRLAHVEQAAAGPRVTLEVVEFRLAEERYAIEQRYVQEIFPLHTLTPLPGVPPFYLGIINIRGQILPVIDLKRFFELPNEGITDLHLVVVVSVEGMELGILADAVSGVRSLAQDSLQASLPTLTGIRSQFLQGVSNEQIVVLDAVKILKDPQLLVNQDI